MVFKVCVRLEMHTSNSPAHLPAGSWRWICDDESLPPRPSAATASADIEPHVCASQRVPETVPDTVFPFS